jgi:NADH:ubiquinone oxidoreductase subunit 6 (subunit J)
MKTLLKFFLLVISLIITFIVTSTALYSHSFKEASSNIQMQDVVYLLINCFWISLTILYVTKKSHATPQHTALSLSFSLFFIYAFMTQIEALLLGNVYVLLDAVPIIVAVLIGIKFFGNDSKLSRYSREPKKFTIMEVIVKLLLTGFFYMLIYFAFGYFVSGRMGAAPVLDAPQAYLIEFGRGLLYGLFVFPVINIFRKKSFPLLISLVLLLETPAIYLLVPDCLFPNTVRIGDLWQTAGILFLFALTTWLVFDKIKAP